MNENPISAIWNSLGILLGVGSTVCALILFGFVCLACAGCLK